MIGNDVEKDIDTAIWGNIHSCDIKASGPDITKSFQTNTGIV